MADRLQQELISIVGQANVLVDAGTRAGYEVDWTRRFRGTARAVVRPASTAEVGGVLAACDADGTPVVAQGGNTGLVGGGVPRSGEVVLSTRRLDALGPVDAQGATIAVEGGATLAAVQDAAAHGGFAFGVDLAARDSATIGGMVATNAGGIHVLRHGPMASQIVGVEAVLADGSVVGSVPAPMKDNTGYHWGGILCGSEGTLAVVTKVHLRLVPRPAETCAALVGTAGFDAAMALACRLRTALPSLQALEVFDSEAVAIVCEHLSAPPPFPEPFQVYVLVECAGESPQLPALTAVLGDAPETLASAVADSAPGLRRLWRFREAITEAIASRGIPHKLDVSVPLDGLAAFAQDVRRAVSTVDPEASVFLFGHAGDGNLHVNVVGPPPDDDTVDETVLELVAERGGSISAEHGIGIAKARYLNLSRTPQDVDAMRRLRRALDPRATLNPGVLFD